MTTNNEQPSPEQTANGEIPEEIIIAVNDFVEKEYSFSTAFGSSFARDHNAKITEKRNLCRNGALFMYRHLAPTIDHLQKSLIQRDYEWKKIYDQLQEKEKEAAEYRKALEEISDGCKSGEIQKVSVGELRKKVEELLAKYPQNKLKST